MESRRE
ncbi:Protein of unknown function [Thermobacillus xylanilyticus]|nr:Protein of unknown function [Thermobacillus xylanilyticus]